MWRALRGALDERSGKYSWRSDHGASRTNDMKPKEPIVGHAQAESTALQKGSQPSLVLCFKVVPLESAAFLNQLKDSGLL